LEEPLIKVDQLGIGVRRPRDGVEEGRLQDRAILVPKLDAIDCDESGGWILPCGYHLNGEFLRLPEIVAVEKSNLFA
jgi:hypothetical protein